MNYTPDHFVGKTRLIRAAPAQGQHKPKPFPAAFLTAVARVVVPARPETKSTDVTGEEASPRLLRLNNAK